jgi:hypothetical protein
MSRLRKTLEGIEIEEEITLDLRRSDSTLIGAFGELARAKSLERENTTLKE